MNDSIIRPTTRKQWRQNAVVGGLLSDEWAYARGYLDAAEILENEALSHGPLDLLFYPVCFLYRHAAEVILKELIRDTERLIRILDERGKIKGVSVDKDELQKDLTRYHKLNPLLERLTERLVLVSDEELPPDVPRAIRDLDAMDPTGQAFRYSRTKKPKGGTRRSFEKQQLCDVRSLGQHLRKCLGFLADGVGSWLEAELTMLTTISANSRARFLTTMGLEASPTMPPDASGGRARFEIDLLSVLDNTRF